MQEVTDAEYLEREAVRVHYAFPERYDTPADRRRLMALLDDHELARYERFRFEVDKQVYLVAHALTRTVLSSVVPEPPAAWSFKAGPHGRPEIAGPSIPVPLRFNLSHTHGLVACAVTVEHDIGVDVERRSRRVEIARIAPRVLADAELADLDAQPDDAALRHRFFQYWTLKEAYIKAVGRGLGMPLQQIAFDLGDPRGATVHFIGLSDDPAAWFFAMHEPTPHHQLAVAVRNSPLERLSMNAMVI